MAKPLRVGIIGASPERGWAKDSHVPAVSRLDGVELAAVAVRGQEAADRAAKAFGAPRGFGDVGAMVRDPDIDLVTVAVRVPSHRELVLQALADGKHVYCEWPLGRDDREAEELRDAAARAGVHAAIGLHARMSPALRRARELIDAGAVGRVLGARIHSGTVAFGRRIDEADLYLEEAANGATHLAIHGGHALDAAVDVLGPLADISALATIQYPEIEVGEARRHARSIPDHVVAHARLETGGTVAVEVAGGRPADTTFRLEVVGEDGRLALDAAAPRGFQSGRLTLSLNGEPQTVDAGELAGMPDAAMNVAGLYAALRDDVASGGATAPDFDHAVRLTRLIAAVGRASDTGIRGNAEGWPLR